MINKDFTKVVGFVFNIWVILDRGVRRNGGEVEKRNM